MSYPRKSPALSSLPEALFAISVKVEAIVPPKSLRTTALHGIRTHKVLLFLFNINQFSRKIKYI
jgi:hypothetical protein